MTSASRGIIKWRQMPKPAWMPQDAIIMSEDSV
jgi:hypothetical protein